MKDLFTSIENGGEWNKEVGDYVFGISVNRLGFADIQDKYLFMTVVFLKNFIDKRTMKIHIEERHPTDNPQGVLESEKAQIKDCLEDLSNMKNFMGDDYEEVRKEILKVISDEL